MRVRAIIDTICFLFIFLFVYAAVSKLLDYQKFVGQIGQSLLVGDNAVWIGWVVPGLEIGISICLALPRLQRTGLYAALSLMVLFTAYIVTILGSDGHVPCACGGVLEALGWRAHLLFSIFFVLLAIAGTLLYPDDNRVIRPSEMEEKLVQK